MDLMYDIFLGKPIWMWVLFLGIILALLILDLGVLQKRTHEISIKESLVLSSFYIILACLFGGWVWYYLGADSGKEYFTGFIIEKTLSVDNIFLFSLIFSFFHIPRLYQHRVLFWGILGVIILRAVMIGVGATLIVHFSWILYIFGIFLIVTGIKMLRIKEIKFDLEKNAAFNFIQRHFHVTSQLHGEHFIVRLRNSVSGKMEWRLTPLMLTLILIELADVVFAIDSVPAIFAITQDPFIVYTSNIFAILGLRALYFALAAIIHKFKYLKPALALILIFIGSKIFIADILGMEKFPASISLIVTSCLLLSGVFISLIRSR
jgi:tellurite resistance protein TerC